MARGFSSLHADTAVTSKYVQSTASFISMLLFEGLEETTNSIILDNMRVTNEPCGHLVSGFEQLKCAFQKSFRKFRTIHMREQYFRNLGTFVPPKSVRLGPLLTSLGRQPLTFTTSTAQLVSLRSTLQRILSIPGVMAEIDSYINALSLNDDLTNIVCSSSWKSTVEDIQPPATSTTLPLLLYFDDFETGNPLGSHAGVHKLGGVYVSIPCLPQRHSSQLAYIFLQYLFHSSDRTTFGNEITFASVISQLNKLATEGVDIDTSYFKGNVRFGVAAIVGDNLGLHSMLGFAEGFTAHFPCRVCRATRVDCGKMLVEDESLLRNEENYRYDLAKKDMAQTGVREECVWLKTVGFDLFRNVGVDAMHDVYEGVAKYVLTLVINILLDNRVFDLPYLNGRIIEFNYGPDSDNKPPPLSYSKKSVRLRLSATECSNLLKYFGMLVGHKVPWVDVDVPHEDLTKVQKAYKLYILLCKCEEIIMARRVNDGLSANLRDFVYDFNQLYLDLSGSPLQPKFHHLVHYPTMLLKFGPVTHLWSMRFEAKHKEGKKAARSSASRVNLCKTVATKIQLQLNDLFVQNTLRPPVFTTSMGNVVNHTTVSILKQHLPGLPAAPAITSHSFVTSPYNITYRRKDIIHLFLDSNSMYPVFGQIQELYFEKVSGECYASYCRYETRYFDNHYLAYAVSTTVERGYIALRNLFHILPDTLAYTASVTAPKMMIISRNYIL